MQKLWKYLATAAFAVALVTLPSISGSSVASAQDGYYRGRDYGRDRGYYDDNHQQQEKERLKRHGKQEERDLKRHQEEERYSYGNSDDLRRHQREEREELKQHKREEKGELKSHQHSERDGYDNDGRYSRTDGYDDLSGNSYPYRRSDD